MLWLCADKIENTAFMYMFLLTSVAVNGRISFLGKRYDLVDRNVTLLSMDMLSDFCSLIALLDILLKLISQGLLIWHLILTCQKFCGRISLQKYAGFLFSIICGFCWSQACMPLYFQAMLLCVANTCLTFLLSFCRKTSSMQSLLVRWRPTEDLLKHAWQNLRCLDQ